MGCPDTLRWHWKPNTRSLGSRATLLLLALAWCGLVAPAGQAQDAPYKGVVSESRVDIRSGGSKAYYAMGTVKQGQMLTVDELYHGWYKVQPPKGVFSYISKAYVNRQGDGSEGVVNRDRAEVKAASLKGPGFSYRGQSDLDRGQTVQIVAEEGGYYKIQPPKDVYVYLKPGSVRKATQSELAKLRKQSGESASKSATNGSQQTDDTASQANANKEQSSSTPTSEKGPPNDEAAPADAAADANAQNGPSRTMALNESDSGSHAADTPPNSSKPGKPRQKPQSDTEASSKPSAKTTANAPNEAESPGSKQTSASNKTSKPTTPPKPAGSSSTQAKSTQPKPNQSKSKQIKGLPVENSDGLATVDQKLKPLFDRPVQDQPIDRMMAAYQQFEGDPQLSRANQRLVEVRLASLKHNKRVRQALEQANQALTENPAPPEQSKVDLSKMRPSQFDAVGILLPSSVYDGNNLPRMLRLVDASSKRTTAYVNPGKPINAKRMIGELVGVLGRSEFDPATKLTVIDVNRIITLSPQASDQSSKPNQGRDQVSQSNTSPPTAQTETATANP